MFSRILVIIVFLSWRHLFLTIFSTFLTCSKTWSNHLIYFWAWKSHGRGSSNITCNCWRFGWLYLKNLSSFLSCRLNLILWIIISIFVIYLCLMELVLLLWITLLNHFSLFLSSIILWISSRVSISSWYHSILKIISWN